MVNKKKPDDKKKETGKITDKEKKKKTSPSSLHSKTSKGGNKKTRMVLPSRYNNVPPTLTVKKLLNESNVIWRRHHLTVKIQQLTSEHFISVIELLQHKIVLEEPMCRMFGIADWKIMKHLLHSAHDWLENCTSLVAVDERNDVVYGTIIGRIINNEELAKEVEMVTEHETALAKALPSNKIGKKINLKSKSTEGGDQKSKEFDDKPSKKPRRLSRKSIRTEASTKTKNLSLKSKKVIEKHKKSRLDVSSESFFDDSDSDDEDDSLSIYKNKKGKNKKKEKIKEDNHKTKDKTKKKTPFEAAKPALPNNKKELKVDIPADVIPVEEASKKITSISVFDDSLEDFTNETLLNFMQFRYYLFNCQNFFNKYKIRCYYKIYVWAVPKEFQKQGIGSALIDAAIEMCEKLEIPLIVSIFTSLRSQTVGKSFGFNTEITTNYDTLMLPMEEYEDKACLVEKQLQVPLIETFLDAIKPDSPPISVTTVNTWISKKSKGKKNKEKSDKVEMKEKIDKHEDKNIGDKNEKKKKKK